MGERDDVVVWLRGRFTDPDANVLDARVLARAASDPDFALLLKEWMEAPCMGPMYWFDIGAPGERARAKPLTLEQLNARLNLIGGYAVPFQGQPPPATMRVRRRLGEGAEHTCPQSQPLLATMRLWTVYVPHSHMRAARLLLAGLYALNG